jgi:hypothetical protein
MYKSPFAHSDGEGEIEAADEGSVEEEFIEDES